MSKFNFIVCLHLFAIIISSCRKSDSTSPIIILNEDTVIHYFGIPYTDAGVEIFDNYDCNFSNPYLIDESNVDIFHYGTYNVQYSTEDANGNKSEATRPVDIILQPSDYFSLNYNAKDTCTSGNYNYTGLIQDCDCDKNSITVGNISNFGLSALFTLDISGGYAERIILDTTRYAITFLGNGIMKSGADTLIWNYTISDSVTQDICISTWVKE